VKERTLARLAGAGAALGLALAGGPGPRAQTLDEAPGFDEIPLEDVLEIVVLERELLAIDARGGGQTRVGLRLEEQLLWSGSRGKVAVALTDQRVLAVATGSAAWQESGWRRRERPPQGALLGDRLALLATGERAIGFDGESGNLVEVSLGPGELVLDARAGANAAVLVTDRRALGLSPRRGGFFPAQIGVQERVESVTAGANLATIRTDRRLLIFRAPSASWEERRLELR
jgi:hypothetical protein